MSAERPILWDIYEEHLDEAAFLWGQRERAMNAANYALDDVIVGPEERLLAHLDGLVLGGRPVAERLLVPALANDDPGKVAAAAWALLQAEDADHLDAVVAAVTAAETTEARGAIGRAFELCHRTDLAARLLQTLVSRAPGVQAAVVRGIAARMEGGASARPGLPVEASLASRDPELQLSALFAQRRAPLPGLAPRIEEAMGSADIAVRDAAIEAGLILHLRAAWQTCGRVVEEGGKGCRLALALLALGGDPADSRVVIKKLDTEAARRDSLWALGFVGTVEAAEAALAFIGDEQWGPLAGESFATITGVTLAGPLVHVGEPDNTTPPEGEEADAPLPELRPEDDLPVPNGERVRAWWEKAKANFRPDVRYLHGHPVTPEVLRTSIAIGPTWRRSVLCLEAAIRSGFDLDIGTWAWKQKEAERGFPPGLRTQGTLASMARF